MSASETFRKQFDHPQFYGRRHGHKLRPGRQRLIDDLLPKLQISIEAVGPSINNGCLFEVPVQNIWLEVGFGAGEHLAGQALAYPEIGFIGCEPFINGVASLLKTIDQSAIGNIRIFNDDARLLLPALPERSLGRVFILFSDPWPKTRHHRRRFFNRETLDQLARSMKDNAELRFASDHAGYTRWALEHVLHHPDFSWPVRRCIDWQVPPEDWVQTRYESKTNKHGGACTYLRICRRPRSV
ncbi:MAG: tRNA (guanine(46)-N(7))-methyltransferase TrmB [Rhodospirillaceae bacterium]